MLRKFKIKYIFILITFLLSIYIVFIKTNLFISSSSILIKNIDGNTIQPSFIGMISGQNSDSVQDAVIVQKYINSYEVFNKIDEKFNLMNHYKSDKVDFFQRMYSWNNYEDFLYFYQKRLKIDFDEQSSILNISFLHTDPFISKEIVNFIINEAENKLNSYNQILANKHLDFIAQETKKNKSLLDESISKLENYQNRYNFIDPSNQAKTSINILSALKLKLVEKLSMLRKLESYQTSESIDIINIKQDIEDLKISIKKLSLDLSGKGPKRINKNIFEYNQLKAKVDLYNELYKQSLLQMQNAKIEVNKKSKVMQVLIEPNVSISYSEPKKFRELITIFLVMSIFYGIISMLIAIIKDHKE